MNTSFMKKFDVKFKTGVAVTALIISIISYQSIHYRTNKIAKIKK